MEKEQFLRLISKYLDGTATPNERLLVEEYYRRLSARGGLDVSPEQEQQLEQAMLRNILAQMEQPEREQKVRRLSFRWAAAAVLLVFITAGGYLLLKKESREQQLTRRIERIVPGGNKAVLTLADGTMIALDDKRTNAIPQQSGTRILQPASGQLVYSLVKYSVRPAQGGPGTEPWNTLATPAGGQYTLQLPDGTAVILDAASSIRYPVAFTGSKRMVEVTGQAYFKVTHNTHQPFSVMVKGQTIEDLGTEFNINAYDDEPFVSTTLLEGSIRLDYLKERRVLKPGQQARTRTGMKGIGISVADTEEVTAWKNGYFRFNDEELESVMRKIARWYNVEVTYKETVTGAAFSGKISRYKNIGQVLKVLSATQAVHFKIEGRRIMVSR